MRTCISNYIIEICTANIVTKHTYTNVKIDGEYGCLLKTDKTKQGKLNGILSIPHDIQTPSKMSTDSEDLDIQQELRNIENVISLTRTNIDALMAKFADYQQPPTMYLKEYEELTSKLHELEAEEQRLNDLCNCKDNVDISEPGRSDGSKLQYGSLPRPNVIRAHLPNQQRTSVQVREGLTLREALAKAMKLRDLICETCRVYRSDTNSYIDWDTDISNLDCEEIVVKIADRFSVRSSIAHNFVRKTFFSLVFCDYCRRLLFQGFYCRTCAYKFHQRCASGVPPICQQVRSTIVLGIVFMVTF